MNELPVPVTVDRETGAWMVEGQPMVLIPRHFWVFIQMEIEKKVGLELAQQLVHDATVRAAKLWCQREAKTHGLSGIEVFRHYLERLGSRGLGRFHVETIDAQAGTACIRLEHSPYVAEYGPQAGRSVCYMYNGAFVGGMEYVSAESGARLTLVSRELECAADGAEYCRFRVAPVRMATRTD